MASFSCSSISYTTATPYNSPAANLTSCPTSTSEHSQTEVGGDLYLRTGSLTNSSRQQTLYRHVSIGSIQFHLDHEHITLRSKKLGSGAYGVVARIYNISTGVFDAIKRIIDPFSNPIETRRLSRELRILKKCNHPLILKLKDYYISPPSDDPQVTPDYYLLTEAFPSNLHKVTQSKQQFDKTHIKFFAYQLLCAIKYLHSASILHRDLKPSNILVNQNCEIRIADFGLSREAEDEELTQYVVTRWYRAPEIMLCNGIYSKAIDIWSIGCILAELLTKEPLFPGTDYISQLTLIIKLLGSPSEEDLSFVTNCRALKFLSQFQGERGSFAEFRKKLPSDTPPELFDLLRRLLTFNPEKRITAAEALEHPYFFDFRDPALEVVAEKPIKISNEINSLSKFLLEFPSKYFNREQYPQIFEASESKGSF